MKRQMTQCYNYYRMQERIRQCEEESRATSRQLWKCNLEAKDQARGKFKDKENSSSTQLKSHLQPQRPKLENSFAQLRETFVSYSKVHFICLSKAHTLFLAFHLYQVATANHALKFIPQTYKCLCCMFLAMKYEEIYPTDLAELAKYLRITFNLDDYRRYEKAILISVGVDLDAQTIDRALEVYFSQLKYDKKQEMRSYYLLELALVSTKIGEQFSRIDILKAVARLVRRTDLEDSTNDGGAVEQIMKLILENSINDKGIERYIFRKYQHPKYESISLMHI